MTARIEVKKVADGLFGHGSISYEQRLASDVQPDTLATAVEAIMADTIIVPIDETEGQKIDDDGCGDGRPVLQVFAGMEEKQTSLNRVKVFGGGPAMAAAVLIGAGEAAGKSLETVFGEAIALLEERQLDFGAHTDDHASAEKSGCGAIDNAPAIVANATKYRPEIEQTITALGVDTAGLDQVLDAFANYTQEIDGQPYSGSAVMKKIIERNKIVKKLSGDHKEMFVILNQVEGTTVNQEDIRRRTDDKVQTFAVDVWRLKDRADKLFPADAYTSEQRHKAYLSELVYTLATSATLTKGDLPVYSVQT